MKKALSVILCVLLLVATVPTGVFNMPVRAATSGTTGDCTWTLDGTVLTISGNGAMGDYAVYMEPWGLAITELIIENGVTTIGKCAFSWCTSLEKITIPDSVTTIGSCAFLHCHSLTEVTIPDGIITVDDGAFGYCTGLTSVTIPDNVTTIVGQAFSDCSALKSVTIGSGVTTVDGLAFSNCFALTSISVDADNAYYCDIDGVLFSKDAKTLIRCPQKKDGTVYAIPDGVTTIGGSAFSGCSVIAELIISDSVTSIGQNAFSRCYALKAVTIGNGVTTIGYEAFYNCSALESVTFGNGVISIDDYAFYNCSALTDVYYIGTEEKAAQMSVDGGNTLLLNATWHYVDPCENGHTYDGPTDTDCNTCGAESTVGTTVAGYWRLEGTVLTISGNGSMGGYDGYDPAPWGTNITKVIIENGVTTIGDWAFYNCDALTEITIPDSVTTIGWSAFGSCSALSEITIPNSVTFIDTWAVAGCSALTEITIPNSVIAIGEYAFSSCSALKTVTIGNGVTTIGNDVFSGCYALESVTIGTGVTTIGYEAFKNCSALTDVYYIGTESKAGRMSIGSYNTNLLSARWHYSCANGHTYDNACDTDCNVCGEVREIEHDYVWVVDKAENCGVNGEKHEECTVCDAVRNENTVISATGNHEYDHACDTVCNVCGDIREIEHDYVWVVDTAETCGEDGEKHQECTVCHVTRNENTVISANGNHAYVWVVDKAENCGVNGEKHEECTVCDAVRNENTVISATGNHEYDHACDTVCNVCGDIREIEHDYVWVVDKAENCGVDGEKHEECAVCHATRNENTVISATGDHIYNTICDTDCTVCGQFRDVDGCPGEQPHATFVVDGAVGKAGNLVIIPVRMERNSGIAGFTVEIDFDDTVLDLISIQQGDFTGTFGTSPVGQSPAKVVWTALEEVADDGVIAYLTFRIKEGADIGSYPISVTYNPDDVFDLELNNVHFATQDAVVEVVTYLSGDLNTDGAVNNKDLSLLLRYLSDWDVDINVLAGDVNGDGRVNNQDLGILLRYLSDWDVVLK